MISNNIFNINSISLDNEFKTKKEVFNFITDYFFKNGFSINKKDLLDGFYAREEEGSTAFTDGIGIPHSKVDAIVKPGIFVLKIKEGIEWESMDDKKTFFFISLAIPNNNYDELHLKMLSSIARKLVDPIFKNNLLLAKDKETIYKIVSEVEIK
ncbi:PTS sugar transporter subunit IIA [Spiroplasma turonicum]|uniref:PTS system fructose-specific IIA component n=1 Tax=Spiroplasma turonicum TaxID=216946 RepID=A0A0K1P6K6_9MOLU|nr:PTS sugar transporter subunit IIA [Spiroplasma turonicum]AKU79938.1 PTS system fructose-specific IIA component [Spiroplasma turonicum]ALX70951.1 PTS system, fructose-specific IIA component [Spiroplasma turonicum]